MTSNVLRIAGIVLCGGRSRRMGQPKAALPFGDETALQRVIKIVGSVMTPVVAVGSTELERPELSPGVLFVHDADPFQGPLSGLVAGLEALEGLADAAYLTGCDTPLLQPEFVSLITGALSEQVEIAVADDGIVLQPLAAVYRVNVLPMAKALLAHGERSLQSLLHASQIQRVDLPALQQVDPELNSLRNMNSPEEYEELLARIRDER